MPLGEPELAGGPSSQVSTPGPAQVWTEASKRLELEVLKEKLKRAVTKRKRAELTYQIRLVEVEIERWREEEVRRTRSQRQPPEKLEISQLRIESPMEITLAVVQGGGVLGVSVYSIHLLRQILHDPERVGSWLPRLVESWHRGMAGAETARYERKQAQLELERAAEVFSKLRVVEVETIGAGDPPDDLVAATNDLRE